MSVEEDLRALAVVVRALARGHGSGCNTQREADAFRHVLDLAASTPAGPLAQAIADIPSPATTTIPIDEAVRVIAVIRPALELVGATVKVGPLTDAAWSVLGAFDREGWKVVCRGCGLEPDMSGIEHLKAVSDGTEDGADVVCLHDCGHAVEGDRVCRVCFGDREPF